VELLRYATESVRKKVTNLSFSYCNPYYAFVTSRAMSTKHSDTWQSPTQSQSLSNHRWLVVLAILILLFVTRQPGTAQTAEAGQVTVTGEPVPTPTPHDNWREMRQHIMPEVSGTQITVTKKATVIKLDQQPPVENNDLQDLFLKAPGFQIRPAHARAIQFQLSRIGQSARIRVHPGASRRPATHE
jgi:hypothetical protein